MDKDTGERDVLLSMLPWDHMKWPTGVVTLAAEPSVPFSCKAVLTHSPGEDPYYLVRERNTIEPKESKPLVKLWGNGVFEASVGIDMLQVREHCCDSTC